MYKTAQKHQVSSAGFFQAVELPLRAHLVVVACIQVSTTVPKEVDHLKGTFTGSIEDGTLLKVVRELCTVSSKQVEENRVVAFDGIIQWLEAPSAGK